MGVFAMTVRAWSTTAADNNDAVPYGAPEGMAPGGVNNVIRQVMADVRDTLEQLPYFDYGHTPTRIDNDTFTVATDLTATYAVGRRIKLVGATTGYATIASSSYSAPDTTVNVTMDSGNVPTSLSTVSLAPDYSTLSSSIEYPITAAETVAGVTPVSYQYWSADILSGHLFRYMTAAEITDIISGTSALNHTTAWTNWSNAVQASKGRNGFAPGGTYNIDSWTVTALGCNFNLSGESQISTSHGVKIKARSTVTDFITINGATSSSLNGFEVDGNNFATNTFRIQNQVTDLDISHITIGGCVDNGVNLNITGATTNTAISELTWTNIKLAGCGSRASGSGIRNLVMNSDQSLVIKFDRLKHFGNTAGATDVSVSVDIIRGSATFITPFATKVMTNDYRFGNGGAIGGIVMVDGRSESDTADSINIVTGTGDINLLGYVHATATNTSLTVGSGFTGRVTATGGQLNNVTNSSATADVVFTNVRIYSTGAIGGTYADRIIRTIGSVLKAFRTATVTTTLTYGTTVTINAALSNRHYLQVSDTVAFTMAAPTNPTAEQTIYIDIRNASGGAMGAITWNAAFKLAGAFTNPANNKRRRISFTYDGASWIEDSRTAADGDV